MGLIKSCQGKIYILGAGLFAEEIGEFVLESSKFSLEGFIEGKDITKCSKKILDRPVLWIDDISSLVNRGLGLCPVGTPKRKSLIQQAESHGLKFTTFVHPSANVSTLSVLQLGVIVSAGCVIATQTIVGTHTIINRGCLIGHHATIGQYVTISPGANIAGKTNIGDGTYIGMGAIILDGITIGKNVIVGAGAVVTKDVPDNVQVIGMPARIVKELS